MALNAETPARGQRLPRSQRRAMLREAALAAFVEHGYHQAAMDDIADRAGVSKPVLYQHFPGKLELYLAILDEKCADLEREVAAALASTDDNKARVAATMRAYFTYIGNNNGAYRLLFESDLTDEPRVAERIDKVTSTAARGIADITRAATEMSESEALLIGMALSGMAQVAARHWVLNNNGLSLEEASDAVARIAWRGFRGLPQKGDDAAESSQS